MKFALIALHHSWRRLCWILALLLASQLNLSLAFQPAGSLRPVKSAAPEVVPAGHVSEQYGQLPLSFEVNQGQAARPVKFLTRGSNYAFFLLPSEAVLTWYMAGSRGQSGQPGQPHELDTQVPDSAKPRAASLRLKLIGAARQPRMSGLEPLPGKSHYLIGNDPKQWKTGVQTFARVKYEEVYPGIDLVYYGHQQQLEYDFRLAPGADPHAIRLHFDGASRLRLDESGGLMIGTRAGKVRQHQPVVYQEIAGIKRIIPSRYRLHRNNQVSFSIGQYDSSRELIIDPVISYSTFLTGTAGGGSGQDLAVDAAGNAYVTGFTFIDSNFPVTENTPKIAQPEFPDRNYVFVSKLSPGGSSLIYSAVIGGTELIADPSAGGNPTYLDNLGNSIALDGGGNAYVVGVTASRNFPTTPGAIAAGYNTTPGAYDILPKYAGFALKLSASGEALLYSTLLPEAFPTAVAVDATGQATLTGYGQDGFPTTPGAFQRRVAKDLSGDFLAHPDAIVAKLNSTGTGFVYATFIGGGDDDFGTGIAVDAGGNAYVTGYTTRLGLIDEARRTSFPATRSPFQSGPPAQISSTYAFAAKFNATGGLGYSVLLGEALFTPPTAARDLSPEIAVDSQGQAYIAGTTRSSNFPTTPGAYQTTLRTNRVAGSPSDGFVMKLNAAGTRLVYSTFFGGGYTKIYGMSLDEAGNAYLTGLDLSDDLNSMSQAGAGSACFAARLTADGDQVLKLFRFHLSAPSSIAVDPNGDAYVTGTAGYDFPTTPAALQQNFAGNRPFTGPGQPGEYEHNFVLKIGGFNPRSSGAGIVHVSAASFNQTSLPPDSIVTAFGTGMASMAQSAQYTPLPTVLAGLNVIVTDSDGVERAAPLFFASPAQVNYLMPSGMANGLALITVTCGEKIYESMRTIESTGPGLFSADGNGRGLVSGLVVRIKSDGSTSYEPIGQYNETSGQTEAAPIDLGPAGDRVFLLVYGTGFRHNSGLDRITAKIGGVESQVIYAGEEGHFYGVDQANILIPRSLAGQGNVEIALTVDGKEANIVNVKIK